MCPPHKSGSFIKFPAPKKQYLNPGKTSPPIYSENKQRGYPYSVLRLTRLPGSDYTISVYGINCLVCLNMC